MIAETIARHGLDAEVRDPDEVDDVMGYDAVVLGSAVYMGRWLEPARRFLQRQRDALSATPTWLFSSGLSDEVPEPLADPAVDLRGSRSFAGKLDHESLTFAERLVVGAVGASDDDRRDWDAIARWASEIADELTTAPGVLTLSA